MSKWCLAECMSEYESVSGICVQENFHEEKNCVSYDVNNDWSSNKLNHTFWAHNQCL